ncbi:MAG TPA: glycosyltransferase [Candidatus Methylomirabilis sp.]|nr:glycosyltransferase [Candidatus Methylomirabilis sp.]
MKILLATTRNPHFPTITEYIERAIRALGHSLSTFEDREFLLPGRLREAIPPLGGFDLRRLNRRLADAARRERPDLLLCVGGERILPRTVEAARAAGARTALWTVDTVKPDDPRIPLAPHFDFVFCGGREMVGALQGANLPNGPYWLPFACDPELHHPVDASPGGRPPGGCDIAFVGSLHRGIYPRRLAMLETLADFDLGVWGPGARDLPASSPIYSKVRGDQVPCEEWTRIYSAAKIVLCAHYDGPGPRSMQASPRVYEILACGGFLLCDDQSDVRALFEDGKDLVIFRDPDDLRQKAQHYLARPEERRAIAGRGREKVLAGHTYRHRIASLLATVTGTPWESQPR